MNNHRSNTSFIFKRSFLGISWGVIIFAPLFVFYAYIKIYSNTINLSDPSTAIRILIFLAVYGLIAGIYSIVISHLQTLERLIRLYTNAEKSDLETMEIAKKVFRNSLKFSLLIFIKYYAIPLGAFLASLGYTALGMFRFIYDDTQKMSHAMYAIGVLVIIGILDWIYIHYYLTSKLRFAWFSYLNNYGNNDSLGKSFKEMRDLNNVSGKSSLFRSLKTQIKNDIGTDAAKLGISTLAQNIQPVSVLGRELKDISRGYAANVTGDMFSYRTLKAQYNLYREAYKLTYGKDFVENPNLLKEVRSN